METIFEASDFRQIIRTKIEENETARGYRARLADAAGCQRSFLSQVLNSHVLPTMDHAVGMSRFWNLKPDETEYFLALVGLARSNSISLSDYWKERLRDLRERSREIAARLAQPALESNAEDLSRYYSVWYYAAIHTLLAIEEFRTPEAIGRRLGLDIRLVTEALDALEKVGLAKRERGQWKSGQRHLHLPRKSFLSAINHANWREKAIHQIQSSPSQSGLHYSVVFSISRKDAEKLNSRILALIDELKAVIEPSENEDLMCFLCDYFRV